MIWNYVREQKPRETNRRRHRRHRVERMRAEIAQTKTRVLDISESGIRLTGAPSWMIPGQGVDLRLVFPVSRKEIRIPVYGKVLRRSEMGMIIVYLNPMEQWSASFATLMRESSGAMA